ncbi:KH domain-containing protein akap-1-like isoform X1 [Portunus trituberculatus]|uniref:KH domain-containing protein akap-1-like isoform X1 n=1 Tax=Portunus trituberculatus TaxID=210409 RepID=UPI001E1CDA67|nr:KH domain-containing protein akap-1-like isoform X1 [Portunus trituberculatus]
MISSKEDKVTKQEATTKGEEKTDTTEKVTKKEEENTSNQEKNKKQKQTSNEREVSKEQKQSNKKQETTKEQKESNRKQEQQPSNKKQENVREQRQVNKKQEQSDKQEKSKKQEENEGKEDRKQEQQQSNKKQENVREQRQANKKQEQSDKQEKSKKQEENEGKEDRKQEQQQSNKKQENMREQRQANKKQEESDKQEKSKKQEENGSKDDRKQEQQQSNKKQENVKEQRQANKKQEESDKQEKSKKQEEKGSKDDRSNNQEGTKRREQSVEKQDVPVSEKSVKEVVAGEQIVAPSVKGDGSKKGSVRSRGDSASADLDCDLGSEQDNMNCDSSSLKSMDSGQGSSEIEPETLFGPANFPASNQEQYIFYDFEIPQMLVGRLIGRKGAFINKIKAATDATVIVHPHKNRKLKLCSVEGTKQQVNAALEMIRKHFPESQYPDITLQQVSSQPQAQPQLQPQVNAQSMQIELTAGVVVEVRVSAVVSGGELWVQQPLHPSYSALHRLQTCMNLNYGDGSNTPPLPGPISDGTVCVAHINDHWMRCQVLSSINAMSVVLLLDIGGTVTVPSSSLRQIRYDYMTLPFQASQCFLHGVQPVTGDMWSDTATSVMEELVSGVILFAVVVSYTEDYVPLINLYRRDKDQFVLLNEKLVELDHAQWISPQHSS